MDENQEEEKEFYVQVSFTGIGSAVGHVVPHNVTPEQCLLAAAMLELFAKNAVVAKENAIREKMMQQQLTVPEKKIFRPGE